MHEKRPRLWIMLVAILEMMTIYLALQDQIVGGLTQGAVKG